VLNDVHMADGKGDHIAVTARLINYFTHDFTNVFHHTLPSSSLHLDFSKGVRDANRGQFQPNFGKSAHV